VNRQYLAREYLSKVDATSRDLNCRGYPVRQLAVGL